MMNDRIKNLQTMPLLEVANVLCISVRTVYRLAEMKDLPIIKVGGTNRVRVADLETYLERQSACSGVPA